LQASLEPKNELGAAKVASTTVRRPTLLNEWNFNELCMKKRNHWGEFLEFVDRSVVGI
jgi:hypothetical protein